MISIVPLLYYVNVLGLENTEERTNAYLQEYLIIFKWKSSQPRMSDLSSLRNSVSVFGYLYGCITLDI